MPPEHMEQYKIDRDDWHFDYTQQGLWNFKELSNRCLNEALERGRQLGIPLYPEGLTGLFFDGVEVRHLVGTRVPDPFGPADAANA